MPRPGRGQEPVRMRGRARIRRPPGGFRHINETQYDVPRVRARVHGTLSDRVARACTSMTRDAMPNAADTLKAERKPSLNPLPNRERMKLARQAMPEQPASVRAANYQEVNLGYSAQLASQEALRCLECAKATCATECPVGVKVKEFVQLILAGDFAGAAAKIRE